MTRSKEYTDYIRSDEWRRLVTRIRKKRDNRCERCKKTGVILQGHHKTYKRLGRERDRDIKILCRKCHRIEDERRRASKRSSGIMRLLRWIIR